MTDSKNARVSTAAIIVMSSLILSRVTGFLRESMLSWKVGLSWVQDAYVAAFTVPDVIYTLLVSGMISAALVPFLSGKLERGEEKEGWRAVSSFINVLIVVTTLVCVLGIIFSQQIIPLVAPGFAEQSQSTRELSVVLARILFPSVLFIMLAGVCNGVLNSYKKFAAAAYGPSIYNITCALSIYLFADADPASMVKVAFGVGASALIYFLVQLAFAFPKFKFYRPVINLLDKSFQKLFNQAIPSLLSSSAAQFNVVISTAFVSLSAVEGSLAAFRNANTLWQLPYGIFAVGIGTAILPALSGKYATGDKQEYRSLLTRSLTSVLFWAVPSSAGFIILREPLVRAVFYWGGKFTLADVSSVASILVLFSVSIISQSVVAILNRAFYALQDTKTPLLIGLASAVTNLGLGAIFYMFTNLGASGMALSYSIISTINAIILLIKINRKTNGIHTEKVISFFVRALPAALIMYAAVMFLEMIPVSLVTKGLQLLYLLAEIIIAAVVYTGIMLLLKAEDAIYLKHLIKQRLNM